MNPDSIDVVMETAAKLRERRNSAPRAPVPESGASRAPDPEGRCIRCDFYSRVEGCLGDTDACLLAAQRQLSSVKVTPARQISEVKFFDTYAFNSPSEAVEEVKRLIFELGVDGGWAEFDEPLSKMVLEQWPEVIRWECDCVWASASRVLVEDLRLELP